MIANCSENKANEMAPPKILANLKPLLGKYLFTNRLHSMVQLTEKDRWLLELDCNLINSHANEYGVTVENTLLWF